MRFRKLNNIDCGNQTLAFLLDCGETSGCGRQIEFEDPNTICAVDGVVCMESTEYFDGYSCELCEAGENPIENCLECENTPEKGSAMPECTRCNRYVTKFRKY